ncbi:MAG: thioredoxin domain-containing protein, partial [Planctomycetes bacterium]|nr:thioredoxin domain-containing protein [Planctomycetota bacterium]
YVWTAEQLQAILSDKQYEATRSVLGVEAEGNWFDHAARERQPTNILHVTDKGEAALAGASPEFRKDFEAARAILLEHRARRVRPSLDDKVMADSNGLMIAAFARGGRLLDEPAHVAAAAKAFDFVWENCRDDDRRLVHYWRGGPSPTPAYLDDYAFLAWGAVELYHATFDPKYLIAAGELVKKMNGSFWDEEEGGYFFTAHDAEKLLTRPKKFSDMAVPSGNSVATLVLTELAQLTGDVSLEDRAARLEQLLARGALGMPSRYTQFAVALETRHATAYEAVVVGDPQAEDTRRMLALLREPRPGVHVAVLLKDVTRADNRLAEAAPFTREYRQQDGKATAYICRRQTCRQPTTDPAVVADYLK